MERKKIDAAALSAKKQSGTKITMLTAYDAPMARMMDEAEIDSILVGDSAGNVVLGYKDTIPVTMDEMIMLSKAVVRGAKYAFVIGDMPYMSYNVSIEESIRNAGRFIKEAGCDAVKLEGGGRVIETVRELVAAGIPVVGHLGLTPQTASMIGGMRVQGRTAEKALRILEEAASLQEAGACMLVMECVPDRLGTLLARMLKIPVIGIGAGSGCDGQVLVTHDMIGIRTTYAPKFVKTYRNLAEQITLCFREYRDEVTRQAFPESGFAFTMEDAEYERLLWIREDLGKLAD